MPGSGARLLSQGPLEDKDRVRLPVYDGGARLMGTPPAALLAMQRGSMFSVNVEKPWLAQPSRRRAAGVDAAAKHQSVRGGQMGTTTPAPRSSIGDHPCDQGRRRSAALSSRVTWYSNPRSSIFRGKPRPYPRTWTTSCWQGPAAYSVPRQTSFISSRHGSCSGERVE